MRERTGQRTSIATALKGKADQITRRPFVRNVAALISGTVASQAVGLIFSPLITRLYGPQAFGVQSIFVTVAGVMGSAAALSYPIAIVLPRRDADALGIARLSMYVATAASLIAAIALYFFGDSVLALFDASEIAPYRLLIPVFMLSSVAGIVVGQWLIRKHEFLLTAKISALLALLTGAIKTGTGLAWPSAISLICANMLGGLAATAVMAVVAQRRYTRPADADRSGANQVPSGLWKLAQRHRDFALYRTPQNLLNAISTGLPVALLASYFGSAAAGFYSVASAVLVMPAGLVGGSVMQVFYPRVTEAIQRGEDSKALIKRATAGLAVTGVIPFALICLAGPALFAVVFGARWDKAGVYAQWLSPWLFLQYINKPAVAAIPALGLQGQLLIYEVFSTASKALALYLGFSIFGSDVAAIALYSAFGVAAYLWLIFWVIARSGKKRATALGVAS